MICFAKYLNFAQNYFRILRNLLLFILIILIFRETNYVIGISGSNASKRYIICLCSESLKYVLSLKNGLMSMFI